MLFCGPVMKKNSILLIGFIVLAFLASPTGVSAETTIKMGVYQNRPLLFQDKDGGTKGIFADILAYIADEEDWEIEYVHGSWSQGLQNLKSADIDLLGPIAYSQERKNDYDFTYENVLTNWGQIYVNKYCRIELAPDFYPRDGQRSTYK